MYGWLTRAHLFVAAALRPPWQVVEHAASGTIVRVAVCGGAREPLSAAQVRYVAGLHQHQH